MTSIEVSPEDIVPLDRIADGVSGLRVLFANVFSLQGANGWTLVDAGLNGSAGRIQRWARESHSTDPPDSIVLTHAHFDHVGALETLLEEWPSPVYLHVEEVPYVTGLQAYPAPDPTVGGGLMARMAALYPRESVNIGKRATALPPDGSIPGLPGWRWIHTPGHTAGHIALFRDEDRVLLAGDAFCTTNQESFLAVARQKPELHGPPAYFTTDWDAARDSVRRLAELEPLILAPGHGQPMSGEESREALQRLARDFDEIARPRHGKYVDQPRRA